MKHRPTLALIFSVSLSLLLFSAKTAFAHSLFIQSGHYLVKKGKDAPFFFSYGHTVPFGDGIRAKKIAEIHIYQPDGKKLQVPVRDGKGLQSHMLDYDRAGIWMLTAQTTPGYYTIYLDQQGKEHHVIKPRNAVKEKAAEIVASYFSKQYAKTCVVCDIPGSETSLVSGMALELVPSSNLFTIKPGETVEFQVYRDGKPCTGTGTWDATYAGFSTQPEDMFYPKSKVENGHFTMMIAHPGRWFVRYYIKSDAPLTEREKYQEMKLSTSFVFQVENKRRRER